MKLFEIQGDTFHFDRKTKQKVYDKRNEMIYVIAEGWQLAIVPATEFADNCHYTGRSWELSQDYQ